MAAGLLVDGRPLPTWAAWAVALGEWLATPSAAYSQTVLAVTLPTRAWTAAFVALGACTVRAGEAGGHSRAEIEGWGVGTAVRFPFAGAYREGVIISMEGRGYGLTIRQPPATDCTIPWSRAGGIERLPEGAVAQSRIRRPGPADRFRAAALGTGLASRTNAIDCLVIGQRNQLEEELELQIAIEETKLRGPLGDLLRPRSMVGPKAQFRSDIVSPFDSRAPGGDSLGGKPAVVILDGSIPVLRQLAARWTSPLLCVIDRTEPRAADAAAALEAARAASGGRLQRGALPSPPDGIEVIGYERVEQSRG